MLTVVIEDEAASRIGDSVQLPPSLMSHPEEILHCLQFVDPYGDTVFNRLQIPVVLKDLETLERHSSDPGQLEKLRLVRELAQSCLKEPHLYLRFIGD